jgi:hypothetical protein
MKGTAMKNKIFLFLIAGIALFSSCSKNKAVEIKEWDQFQGEDFKVSFNYPKNWVRESKPTEAVITSSAEAAEKFFDRDSRKEDGVQIIIASERENAMQGYFKYIQDFKNNKTAEGYVVKEIEDAKIEGLDAKKVSYAGVIDEKTKLKGICIATLKDSVIYYVQFSGFNDQFDAYRPVLDSVLNSLTLPKPKVQSKDPNAFVLPSQYTKVIKNNVLEMTVPDNMNETYPTPKGEVAFAMNLKIYREDCTMDADVRPAKKLTLDKVVEQNSKKIANVTGKGGTVTISGENARFFNYSPARGIKSRIYFTVKNNKIYRFIFNYYAPMEKEFLPAYEKVVASIRLK